MPVNLKILGQLVGKLGNAAGKALGQQQKTPNQVTQATPGPVGPQLPPPAGSLEEHVSQRQGRVTKNFGYSGQ